MKRVLIDYGIEICEEDSKYYLIFDDGGIVSHYASIEISKDDAHRAMKSASEAGEVILHYQIIEDQKKRRTCK